MKKIILAGAILITVFAMASCGSSRKYGCPAVAKLITQITSQA